MEVTTVPRPNEATADLTLTERQPASAVKVVFFVS
jgi:hypothetical protein